jgi:hypothetical protein
VSTGPLHVKFCCYFRIRNTERRAPPPLLLLLLLLLYQVMVDTVDETEDTPNSSSSSSSSPMLQVSPEGIPLIHPKQQQQQQGGGSSAGQGLAAAPSDQGLNLRFVLSPGPTPAAQLLVNRRLEALGQGSQQQQQQPQMQAVEVGGLGMGGVFD